MTGAAEKKEFFIEYMFEKQKMVYYSTHCQQRKLLEKNITPHQWKKLSKPPKNFGIHNQ